jgi:hypothetical protein
MSPAAEDAAALRACLTGLDALIYRAIFRLRARYQLSLDEFRGLYISDEQVEALARELRPKRAATAEIEEPDAMWRAEIAASPCRHSRLAALAARFELSAMELLLLLVAVAPGLDPKYETLYAYLNNDVTRKLPSLDLALRLLAIDAHDELTLRAALLPGSTLLGSGLLRVQPARDAPFGAAQQIFLHAHGGLPNYLLGLPFRDEQIDEFITLRTAGTLHALARSAPGLDGAAARIQRVFASPTPRLILLDPGPSLTVTDAALALASGGDRPLLALDLRRLARDTVREAVGRAALVAQLTETFLLIDGIEALQEGESRLTSEAAALRSLIRVRGIPVFIAAPPHLRASLPFDPTEYMPVTLGPLPAEIRRALWSASLVASGLCTDAADVDELARRFRLGPAPIQAATLSLADDADAVGHLELDRAQLFAAARGQADTGLERVAQRVAQRHRWQDLVLPTPTLERVRALTEALRSRERVLEEWGMGRVLGTVGLRALFAGPSGTGKTMTAGIIARELGVDAYRIDLSQTVSKYIGETEKNLERIFQAAERAHAILFFDEADALLGKRSEVKDAHDRYANIEVAYLLQRLEEFDGIVIVATNVSRNIDGAFSRRMQFVIEFPLPGIVEREQLWRSMFPATAPLAPDIDFEFLGRRFELAGGDIRNVALDAAFLAARHDQSIGMRHIVPALAREVVKQGRSPSAAEFRQHFSLLESSAEAG